MKKIIGYIMIVLLFAGSIAGIYFGIKYNSVKNDKANIDAYKQQIEELTNNVKDLTSDIEDLESLVASQEETITGLTGDKSELEATITSLNETISSLTAQVEEYQSQIETLNSTIASKDELLEEYSLTISNLQSQIESLNATITSLNNMITYYEELVASYDFAGKSIITFKVKDNVYDVIVAESDETFHYDVTDPSLIGYTFTGWSSDNETTIDLQSTTFPQDTTLYALFEEKTETFTVNSSATIRTTDHTSTPLAFNSYIDITGSTVNNVELLTYASPNLLDITEPLTNFTTVKDSSIEVVIPMSFISENYPDLVPSIESDTYFKAVYSYFGDEFILTDFDWYIKFNHPEYEYNYSSEITSSEEVKYITSLNSKVYNLTKTDMFSRDEYVVTLSENEDGIVLTYEDQELSYTKSTSNMYFVNETIDDTLIQFTFGINEDYTISILWFYDITGGNISVTESTGELEEPEFAVLEDCTFSGNTLSSYTGTDTNITIPSSYSIAEDGTFIEGDDYQITRIGEDAFRGCTNLTSVVLSNGITSIESSAFRECSSLLSIVIPNSVTSIGSSAFWGCTSLNSIVIPDNVTSINSSTFRLCDSLTSITIPSAITTIGMCAFYDCGNLETVMFEDGSQLSNINGYAFQLCESIISINLENCLSLQSIGDAAFQGCTSLTSIIIPSSVETIGSSAFINCNFTSVVFEEDSHLTSIGSSAFSSCSSLTSITIPASVTSIGSQAFSDCDSLTSIEVDPANTAYSSDEYGVLFNKDKTILIQYPAGNTCTSYTIPDSVLSIDSYSFTNCNNLELITIPASVTSIGYRSFAYCGNLGSIIITATVPPTLSWNTFVSIFATFYVSNDSVEAYKTAWSDYADLIKSIDELEVA